MSLGTTSPEEATLVGRWVIVYQNGPCDVPLLVNHDRRLVVWAGEEGRGALQFINEFYDLLGICGWFELEEL